MRLHILLSLALVSGLSGSGGSARVDDAVLHVVVTTDHGQPVHGLPKEDFYVAVDGVERQVLSASERLHTDCSVVVFVDDVHIMPLAQDGVRWLIHQFVERLDPHASVALVPGVAKVDVEFASDRKSVLSVADAQTFKPPRRTGPGAATLDDAKSLDTLQSIAEQLSTRGAGRKIIIWLLHPLHTSASTTVTALSRRLTSLDVTLYAVNPAMVKAYADTLWLEPNLPSTADIVGPQGVSPGIAAVTHLTLMSGGFAVLGGNPVHGGLTRLMTEIDNYYDVTVAALPRDKKPHSVTVGVKREGLVVRARHVL
jgi:VWFA-related protein